MSALQCLWAQGAGQKLVVISVAAALVFCAAVVYWSQLHLAPLIKQHNLNRASSVTSVPR